MTRSIWWVRHAPTHARTMIGWTDVAADLSDHDALYRLSAVLPADAVVVSSDLTRARDTATAITGGRTRLNDMPELREIHFGDWENRHFADIEAEDPERLFAFWDQPGAVFAPRGENWDMFSRRVDLAAVTLAGRVESDLIIVAHLGVILSQVQKARGVTAKEAFAQKIDNLSVTQIRRQENGRQDMPLVNHCP